MRKAIVSMMCTILLVAGLLTGTAPASRGSIGHRIHETQERLDRANAAGLLSRYQRYRLQHKLDKIRYKYDRMREDGLSYSERERFEDALRELNAVIPSTRRY